MTPLRRLVIAALVWMASLPVPGRAEVSPWDAVPVILARIQPPVFPDRTFDVTLQSAWADGRGDSRPAILAAIEACSRAGGGRVVIPPGDYLCNGPVVLKSNVNLHLAAGCTLRFGTNPDDYLIGPPEKGGCVPVTWEGVRCWNYSPLITASGQTNIAVTGLGTIDGQTGRGWAGWLKKQGPAQKRLRAMGQAGVPVEERVFGRGYFLRPTLFEPTECQNVLLEGVTMTHSPFWTIHPVRCTNVTIRGVTVVGQTWNDDGCDPESCTDVLIERCQFTTRDDNIAIKAGRDNDAWAENGGRPCENIIIRDCDFLIGSPGGVAIGSEMSGDIRNVFVENCRMPNVQRPIYLKSNPDRGGVVENIHFRKITIGTCKWLIQLEMNYKNITRGQRAPVFRNISVEDLTCNQAEWAIDLRGLPESPLGRVTLRRVQVQSARFPLRQENAPVVTCEDVSINGQPVSAR